MSVHGRSVVLEVERKFCRLRIPLTIDGGHPRLRSLNHLGRRSFRDTYYDRDGMLSSAGLWVRSRDGTWQSKIRQAGNYDNSQFLESENPSEIRKQVEMITKQSSPASQNFGLFVTADFVTYRETWKANERFTIVLDKTDFGHVVGEVELEEAVPVGVDAKVYGAKMDADISEFMHTYRWAFSSGPAVGKLTAYFNLKGRRG